MARDSEVLQKQHFCHHGYTMCHPKSGYVTPNCTERLHVYPVTSAWNIVLLRARLGVRSVLFHCSELILIADSAGCAYVQ